MKNISEMRKTNNRIRLNQLVEEANKIYGRVVWLMAALQRAEAPRWRLNTRSLYPL